jgi:hypothetical protein
MLKEKSVDWINIIITAIAVYFAKDSYDRGDIKAAMFWALLLGWDLHVLAYYSLS